ncbi:transglutaminase domain-containing protein [Labilibaculum euxinus]|uniref:Transglutaminase domain-containing protein n=1 Tax=Labilibaculum euxinus TaxID=2686357 RepID=A0A7M4D8X9_9BACT|nr:transglutaminase domain-containing protein [Labilibaculum euxinus]MUP39108.1 transglutaminase domain-containing protein [Labilibaculum euxinus]MVB08313.1 transglutaminase domain-containing protein [Labilibaculum euxinus]
MRKISILLLGLIFFWGCSDVHFIQDNAVRAKISNRFEKRKEFASNRSNELFSVFQENITTEEKEALQFLYAYMPLCDLADYNGDFFLKQVRSSFEARESFEWGKKVPDELFRHFVLPYRVNNENLDSARWVFLKELKPRLKGMSMKEAVLEVNHWCHEKVNYAPTDIRTSGPLSIVRTSWGRCGEESTFTVTALRSVGIPARQVYTPRWAHSDDNHAWVEVWADGKWSYLGACEPEPDLNMGWFTEPARRAMLVHTKVFGDFEGDYEVVKRSDNFTEINVVENYADVKKIYVQVVDQSGNSVENARVDFGLYNYAEFYPIASKNTDSDGISFLTTGLGDLLIWAGKEGEYAGRKISVKQTDTLCLELGRGFYGEQIADLNMVPPVEQDPYSVDESKKKQNDIRLSYEDSIRMQYRTTFIDSITACKLADEKSLDAGIIWNSFKKSQGNWKEIQKFIESTSEGNGAIAVDLLNLIADKDLRDTRSEILEDHLSNTIGKYKLEDYSSKELYLKYVLNPRISNEWLIAYRGYLQKAFQDKFTGERSEIVEQIKQWILDEIQITEEENYYNLPITPKGVYELRISNAESRDVFFVALCRSLGIPSRLEPAEKTPQYFDGKEWLNIYFEKQIVNQPITGFLMLNKTAKDFDPAYYMHFTIGKMIDGVYESLDYGWDSKLSDLPSKLELEAGKYRLVTGKRGIDGTVYAHLNHFEVFKNQTTKIDLIFRDPKVESKILGHLDINLKVFNDNGESVSLKSLEKQDVIVLMWLEPGKEPTRHLMEEFKDIRKRYQEWNGNIVVLQAEEISDENLTDAFFANMPSNYKLYKDKNNELIIQAKKELRITGKVEKPLLLVLHSNGDIQFASRGYKIGIHEHLLKILEK